MTGLTYFMLWFYYIKFIICVLINIFPALSKNIIILVFSHATNNWKLPLFKKYLYLFNVPVKHSNFPAHIKFMKKSPVIGVDSTFSRKSYIKE